MEKKLIMDDLAIQRSLKRITHEIIEHNKGIDDIILVGIRSRGVYLARRLAALIKSFEHAEIPVYALDVSFWRDDHKRTQNRSEAIPVQERKVILVDDVLFKGRTIRAAMDAITSFGRAREIQLAVLIDRGHRELPIRADYIGKNIPSALHEQIMVRVEELDHENAVYITS
ncbi:MAG TPA: bifunctional pyr operon transcriptional regulator/uracil phosphoribosyltransferase PyrR [Candidatus Merdibacter merdavium]|uniref:Bifunctional protein PyrR n=1 Tax=Candidatus Merdibacter merdavium TaxID=2838692 RepID=A0A9D2NUF2_9FIRM|nr:bifunctional pyr operon transcriptional regulator/uracil phosphoribosyltransferase PyrR [Candidatus Merdibacter merdavium]